MFSTIATFADIFHSPVIIQAASSGATCNGSDNGTISINATGGTGQLDYSIYNVAIYFLTNNFDSLASGIFYISIIVSTHFLTNYTALIS